MTEVFQLLQNEGAKEVTISLINRLTSSNTNLDLRSTFDQMESHKHEVN